MGGTTLRIAKIAIVGIVLVTVGQLSRWQILQHEKWDTEAKLRHELMVRESPQRGEIISSDGAKLAYNQKVYGVYVLPKNVKDYQHFANKISEVIDIDNSEVLNRLNSGRKYIALQHKASEDMTLEVLRIDCEINSEDECGVVELENPELYAIRLEEQSKRVYPEQTLLADTIGYVGETEERGEEGKYGVEAYYNSYLEGKYGVYMGLKDQSGRVIVTEDLQAVTMQDGTTIQLTIDRSIQKASEKVVKDYVLDMGAKSGTIVVMRPDTGELLGVANYPTFNPNEYWVGEVVDCELERYEEYPECDPEMDSEVSALINELDEELEAETENREFYEYEGDSEGEDVDDEEYHVWDIYLEDPTYVYKNPAVSNLYEPGSVAKIMTVAAGVDSGAIEPTTIMDGHPGCIEVDEKQICTYNKKGSGNQTIKDCLLKSDNICAYYIAKSVGTDGMYDYLDSFGIGHESKPGISGEENSVQRLKTKGTWIQADLATASFGQGIVSVTPIQLISAVNSVANGGVRVQPRVVAAFIDEGVAEPVQTKVIATPISPETSYETSELLRQMIDEVGWGHRLGDVTQYYTVAGKTGTAQIAEPGTANYYSDRVNTSFIGWVPAHDPEVIILVRLEEPQEAKMAYLTVVPMWNDIAREVVTQMNIPPDRLLEE